MPTAVVTGAARGLGRAMAERLLADGFLVWAVDSDDAELTAMARQTGATPFPMDVTDLAALDVLVDRVAECDALVNNAAIWRFTPLATTPVDEARQVLEINVVAPLMWMQRFLPLLARSDSASIVNISSITAAMSPTGTGLYPPSKAALEAMTRLAAVEFGPQGIRCNAVGPGIIPTEGTISHYGDEATRERRGRTLPAQRFGRPDEIAAMTVFLASGQASFVQGALIDVDGGETRSL